MTNTTNIKIKISGTIVFVLMLLAIILADEARAGGDRETTNITNNYYAYPPGDAVAGVTSVTEVYSGMSDSTFDKGMAMSAAGDTCVFDYAAGWQGCVGGGWYGSESALNGSIVTRVDNFALRFNLQTDAGFNEQAYGVGGSWHF